MELTRAQLWVELNDIAHPHDRPLPAEWQPYYWALFQLARRLAPRRIVEIGVRAGYSAFTMLRACPEARLLGIEGDLDERRENTHGGRRGMVQHAVKILHGSAAQILIVNSHDIRALPICDLVYVDGDHTGEGCLADLRLATAASPRVLVDDYCSIDSVREACRAFLVDNAAWRADFVENSLTGFLLLTRDEYAVSHVESMAAEPDIHQCCERKAI